MSVKILDDVVAPFRRNQFFDDWGREVVRIPGPPDKFSHFFNWTDLNEALSTRKFDSERLRLLRAGKAVEPENYCNSTGADPVKMGPLLSAGASLVLSSVDRFHGPTGALCAALERHLRQGVSANCYAGWRYESGFGIHWDSQNIAILQVSGRKRWKLWRPTRLHPLKQDAVDTTPRTAPAGTPDFDFVLEQGGLLSFPRGWWHDVIPVGEPCLHLTITVPCRTGIDLLKWMADRMKESEAARQDVPTLASADEQAEWLGRLKADLDLAWRDGLVERFMEFTQGRIPPRSTFRLPDLGTSAKPAEWIQLVAGSVEASSGNAIFAGGRRWNVSAEDAVRMIALNDRRPHKIADLCGKSSRVVIAALAMAGVVEYVPSEEA